MADPGGGSELSFSERDRLFNLEMAWDNDHRVDFEAFREGGSPEVHPVPTYVPDPDPDPMPQLSDAEIGATVADWNGGNPLAAWAVFLVAGVIATVLTGGIFLLWKAWKAFD